MKEAAGSTTRNRELKNKGKSDQAKARAWVAAHKVKDAVTR
jgi:uncharacterized protein YjbJ (UPF0337 family)